MSRRLACPHFDEMAHTSYISENNMGKVQSLAMSIFDIKMMVKSSAIEITFKSYMPLQSYCCPVLKIQPDQLAVALQAHVGIENTLIEKMLMATYIQDFTHFIFRDVAGVGLLKVS